MRRKEIEMASIVIPVAMGITILAGGIYFTKIGRRSDSVGIIWIGAAIITLGAVLVLIATTISTTPPLP